MGNLGGKGVCEELSEEMVNVCCSQEVIRMITGRDDVVEVFGKRIAQEAPGDFRHHSTHHWS